MAYYEGFAESDGFAMGTWSKASRFPEPILEVGIKPVLPAKAIERLDVNKGLHRARSISTIPKPYDPEKEAVEEAIEAGNYIGWRLPGCFHETRVRVDSLCHCGHELAEHQKCDRKIMTYLNCMWPGCRCREYVFRPSRPEEISKWN